jgi:hypothetical protein
MLFGPSPERDEPASPLGHLALVSRIAGAVDLESVAPDLLG